MAIIDLHLVVTVLAVTFVLVAMMGLRQHRSPQSAFAWLLFTALLPYVGVPAFLALGNRKSLPRPRLLDFHPEAGHAGAPAALPAIGEDIARLCAHSRLPPANSGNSITLLPSGSEAWTKLHGLIEGATDRLDLAFYKWSNDSTGLALADLLAQRARNGVRVRLLLDGYGSRWRPRKALSHITENGGELRIFAPLVDNPIRGHVNLRNHRKLAIADCNVVFSGGMNVGLEYLGPQTGKPLWADLGYLAKGPVVADHQHVFEADWMRAINRTGPIQRIKTDEIAGGSCVQLIPSGPDIEHDVLHDVLVLACHRARGRITIVTPYFLPSPALSGALSIAARSGVDVRILTPKRSNQRIADLARTSFLAEMQQSGVQVLVHPGMIHAKAIIFDDIALVGSTNLDIRSLFINFETMLVLYDNRQIEELNAWSADLVGVCSPWQMPARASERLIAAIFRLAAPLM